MKIAFPTNDGLTLCPDFGQTRGFLILTYELGEITGEEMRWHKLSDILSSSQEFLSPICDCQVVMAEEMSPAISNLILKQKKEIVRTHDSIITNAFIHYRENALHNQANTCCCP